MRECGKLRASVLALLIPGVVACSPAGVPAGLEVLIATNLSPSDYDAIRVDIEQRTEPGDAGTRHSPITSTGKLPTSLAIAAGKSPSPTADIVVTATKRGTTVVRREVTVDVPTTRVAELVVVLSAACAAPCGSPLLRDASCGPAVVDGSSLPPYQPGDLDRIDAGMAVTLSTDASVCDAAPPRDARVVDAPRLEAAGDDGPEACTCVAPLAGWSIVALTPSQTCPAGFSAPLPYVENVMAQPFTCGCTCSRQVCTGSATLDQYTTACTGTPTRSTELSFTNACGAVAGGPAITSGDSYRLSQGTLAASPACTGTATVTDRPTLVEQYLNLCTPIDVCAAGACLTTAEQSAMCIGRSGSVSCPSRYPSRTVVAQDFVDSRGCGPCECESNLVCTLSNVYLDSLACPAASDTTHVRVTPTTCVTATSTFNLNYARAATATGSGACTPSVDSAPTGAATLDGATTMTVCCP